MEYHHRRHPFQHQPSLDSIESGSDDSDGEEVTEFSNRDQQQQQSYYRGHPPPGHMLDTWLAELDSLTTDLDSRQGGVDPFRFSQATLEDAQEDELNAILGELSALQQSLDREIKPSGNSESRGQMSSTPGHHYHLHHHHHHLHHGQISNGKTLSSTGSETGGRTESPDNDSGFSDNASLLSSGSSLSASGSSSGSSTTSTITTRLPPQHPTNPTTPHHSNEHDEKAEKIRVALAKMRAASVTRLYVKAFSPDGSSKALMVEEPMSCGRVLALLADKNHVSLSPKWALVEHLPHLHMERIYEDHENMVENLLMWTRDSKNKIYFVEREDKYDVFTNPGLYFVENGSRSNTGEVTARLPLDEHGKTSLIEEFFSHGLGVPEVESWLYLKAEGKKAWKKFPFVLRASGIYYFPKGKSHSSKDLICLTTLDQNIQTYEGVGWKKKFKAPSEYGFVLKPARLQVKSHRHMKYLCAEDEETLRRWMVGLRIAKHGKVLWENFRSLQEEIAHEDLDLFGRSVSLASMPIQISTNSGIQSTQQSNFKPSVRPPQESVEEVKGIQAQPILRNYSTDEYSNPTSSSGHTDNERHVHLHNNELNSTGDRMVLQSQSQGGIHSQTIVVHHHHHHHREEGFESDAPIGGTIKRKPSTVLAPKIPLTLNTRSLVSDYITPGEGNTVTLSHTLQRKRSVSATTGGCSSGSSSSSTASTLTSPIITHNPIVMGKPPVCLVSNISKPNRIDDSVILGEESLDSLEIANLPPPPPELLEYNGFDEVNVVSSSEIPDIMTEIEQPLPPPPPPQQRPSSILKMSATTASPPTSNSRPPLRNSQSLPKKGVTFANELSQRLMSRNNSITGGSTIGSMVSQPNPKRLDDPSQSFLTDLQRVMQKKWQVAQKCQLDSRTNPHEILGFRFEQSGNNLASPMEECYSENGDPVNPVSLHNVRAWVSQHYGSGNPNLELDVQDSQHSEIRNSIPPSRISFVIPTPPTPIGSSVVGQQQVYHNMQPIYGIPGVPLVPIGNQPVGSVVIYENFQGRKSSVVVPNGGVPVGMDSNYQQLHRNSRKPPPPIPKRADSTHLSAHFVYN